MRRTLADLLFSGVFERHPGLRIGTVEHELGWIPFFLETARLHLHRQAAPRSGVGAILRSRAPSRRSSSAPTASPASRKTPSGLRLRDMIGVETLMWGSDYPHTESTFPRSRQILAEMLEGVPADEA